MTPNDGEEKRKDCDCNTYIGDDGWQVGDLWGEKITGRREDGRVLQSVFVMRH